METNIETIVIHYLENNIPEEERMILVAWLEEEAEHKEVFLKMKHVYDLKQDKTTQSPQFIQQSWRRMVDKIEQFERKEKTFTLTIVGRYAAVAILAVTLTLGGQWLFIHGESTQPTVFYTEAGEVISHITLPDGSKATLNASTQLSYTKQFGRSTREVTLDGEAFFQVQPNKKIPFIVKSSKQKIEVLGTSFNVMDYANNDYAITSLRTGLVKLQALNANGAYKNAIYLKPNQQVFVETGNTQPTVSAINKDDWKKKWVNKVFVFNNEPFSLILQRMAKLYHKSIRLENKQITNVRYSGMFTLDQPIENVLEIINNDRQFSCILKNDTIIIK